MFVPGMVIVACPQPDRIRNWVGANMNQNVSENICHQMKSNVSEVVSLERCFEVEMDANLTAM